MLSILLSYQFPSLAQNDSLLSKLTFETDFRFRVEQDWNSRKSDGTYRDDRTRFRYRIRAGVTYSHKWYETGIRLRTGNARKQQDPQLTLGAESEEFSTLPIGLEKSYFQGKWKKFGFWIGKNTFPFEKSNELFWSDNVFPEGVSARYGVKTRSKIIDSIDLRGGHFIVSTSGKGLDLDRYFQGAQTYMRFPKIQLELFPAMYHFSNIANIPDGGETFAFDYSIVHIGSRIKLLKKTPLRLEFDYYSNLQDYGSNDSIPENLKGQKMGFVAGLRYGNLKRKGDWLFKATYAHLQRYSAVDFMAQNDWARWDYFSFGSPDGRLTNYQGMELVASYKVEDKVTLTVKYYLVEQLVAYGPARENGSRIRFDLDVKF